MRDIRRSGLAVEDALTHGNPLTRVVARCTVAGWIEPLADWINAEVERDTEPGEIIEGLTIAFTQTVGSIAAQTFAPPADDAIRQLVVAGVDRELIKHVQRVRENMRS